jgi:hypothetical protein
MELLVTTGEVEAEPELPAAPVDLARTLDRASPHDADVVLVGIELGGLMRSDDSGASFSDHRPGAARDVHCLTWHPSVTGRAYEAGGDGTAWSRDGGVTWEPADTGRDRRIRGRRRGPARLPRLRTRDR